MLAAGCWGVATVMTKGVLDHVAPLTLLVVQLVASLGCLLPWLWLRQRSWSWDRRLWPQGLLGLLNPGLSYSFSLLGLALTSASLSTLLWAAEPVLIIGLAWLILRERLTPRLAGLAAVASLGVLLVIQPGAAGTGRAAVLGNLLILAGVLCCALYTVLARRLELRHDPLLIVAAQEAVALVWALLIWPFELRGLGLASLGQVPLSAWAWAAVSGVIYYALAFWFYLRGLQRMEASRAGLSLNLIPVFGLSTAYLFLGERLSAAQWAGAALILAAVTGVLLSMRQTAYRLSSS